jgi:hypothetical protein
VLYLTGIGLHAVRGQPKVKRMEKQLPPPIIELLLFNLYLGSVTYLLGIALVVWVMKRNKSFNWVKLILIAILLVTTGCFFSLLIWSLWTFEVDIMFGPIHLPTLIALPVLAVLLLRMFNYKIITRQPAPY